MRRLLDAYSHRNPATGYCQSMNFIAASLLLHMPEPRAFWAFCCLLELALPDGLHASQLHGVNSSSSSSSRRRSRRRRRRTSRLHASQLHGVNPSYLLPTTYILLTSY